MYKQVSLSAPGKSEKETAPESHILAPLTLNLLDWWLHLSRLHCFCETESIRLTAVFSYLEISNELISNPDLQDPVLYLDRYMEQSIIHWYSERLNTFDVKF